MLHPFSPNTGGRSKAHQKEGGKKETKSHLDTISLTEGKHLRHSSWNAELQGSKVAMTNE